MSGVTLQVRPGAGRPVLPMGWAGPRGYVASPRRGRRGSLSRPAALGVLLAVVLAAGGTVATVAARPASPPSVACAPAGVVAGLSPEQRQNATRIIAAGQAMGLPPRAELVALATAMQESTLRNNPGGDRDSAGLFQQRPSQGWGSYAQVTDPGYASRTFYQRLTAIPGWDRMPVTLAAQAVQRSAFPNAYAKWEKTASALVAGTNCAKK